MTDTLHHTSFKVYDSARRGSVALEELRGVWQYRDLIFQLVRRDIVTRYKRSVLGIGWTMIQPLGMMLILTLVFSQLFHQVRNYPIYVLSGLITWTFFSQTTVASIRQMVWGEPLLHRIYLPRSIFCVAAIGTGLINLVLSFVPLVVIALFLGTNLHISIVFIPVAMLMLAAFSLGFSLILSTMALSFPDVLEMYQVLLTAWMYLTPILYPRSIVTSPLAQAVFQFNPMLYLVEIFREPIYEGRFPDLPTLTVASLISFGVLAAGWLIFASQSDRFTYEA